MNKIIHRSNERGSADHGWLKVNHSFSFSTWYDPNKMNFGALRVLNDDQVAPAMGFGQHPHDNMEIITIPLSGSLRHRDTLGNTGDIKANEIQVMSAGTGIQHSEINPSQDEWLRLFQIWIIPKERNVAPRYEQLDYSNLDLSNNFVQLISPNADDEGLWIHQDAWIHMTELDQSTKKTYEMKKPGNGLYLMVVEGEVNIAGDILSDRDAIGISDITDIEIEPIKNSKLLLIEVPMKF